jgi:hypothetical protein
METFLPVLTAAFSTVILFAYLRSKREEASAVTVSLDS